MPANQPLRILHLTGSSEPGGLSRYLHDLCQAMQNAGHQVAIAGGRGPGHDLFASAPWPWIDAPLNGGPIALLRAAKILRKYLAEHPVDILHAHYRKATLVARRLQKSSGTPVLYTLHSSHLSLSGAWRWLSDFGDYTQAASSDARKWLIEQAHVPAEQITLISHGIDAVRFPIVNPQSRQAARTTLNLAGNDLVALYVGRLDHLKNEEWMLDLAAASRGALPNLRVLLAGDGPHESDLRRRIERENLAGRVRLLGHRDPLPLYHAADALLLPSQREGFSLVCAEAMCAGIPVLRTRTSGTADLIVEGVTGRSTEIDHDAFVSGAIEFLSNPAGLAEMGANAARHIRGNFTFARQLEQTIALYRRILEKSSK
jgi:glycosyltransferase involved in cell wall biosynthesis